jgi:predicted 3-demethylubiquinone-9 3-methyltransferase (glyoxalase superfamily)
MQKINPCLWFNHQAEEAAKFYTSLFGHSKIGKTARFSEAAAEISGQKAGSVMTVEFELEHQNFLGLNGGPLYKFSPSISFFVYRKTEKEVDLLWQKLSTGGRVLMDLDKYPWAPKYGWCEDKFGVSWQVMVGDIAKPMAPSFLFVNRLLGKGEEAVKFYTSVFKNSKIEQMHQDPQSKMVMHCSFLLEGQPFILMEGEGAHKHEMTPAISFVVNCETQAEIDHYWAKLCQEGRPDQCGWLTDKFGVSWQIVPSFLGSIMNEKVMKELLKMTKIEIEVLKKASEE